MVEFPVTMNSDRTSSFIEGLLLNTFANILAYKGLNVNITMKYGTLMLLSYTFTILYIFCNISDNILCDFLGRNLFVPNHTLITT